MRVLVCGGRDFFDAARVCSVLDYYHSQRPFSVVIHGNAPGADRSAGDWATSRGVPVQAFPGRAGTRNMKEQARRRNVPVLEIPPC